MREIFGILATFANFKMNRAPLVPVFTFGENELFRQFPNPKGSLLRRIQDVILNTLRVPLLTPTTFLPNRHPVTTVGKHKLPEQLLPKAFVTNFVVMNLF